jgi:hypothetical protein
MSRNPTLLAICLLGLNLSIDPSSAAGQASTSASDSTAPAASDSQPAAADSIRAPSDSVTLPGIGNDTTPGRDTTAAGDSIIGSDTTGRDTIAKSDSTRRDRVAGSDTTFSRSTVSIEPADSILSAACPGAQTVARDLLVIVFAPEASGEERTAVARTVQGKLLGPVSSAEPGAYYLRVPSGGEEHRLRAASDELIQLAPVRQVGSRACPPPTPRNPG